MPKGFFAESNLLASKAPTSKIPKCGACGLFKTCTSPKMEPTGKGKRKILIVAEAPGEEEDAQGRQLVGNSGKFLAERLRKFGIDLREDCWLTNAIICRPPKNRKPDEKEIDYCQPNLINTIKRLDPVVIIPLGEVAVKSLLSWTYTSSNIGSISKWVGFQIPNHVPNTWICPNYHPSYLLRSKDDVLSLWFDQYLEAAVKLTEKPWEEVPDYSKKIDIIFNAKEAAAILCKMQAKGGTIAFDYECNMLKPDSSSARIISCSVSWLGKKTIAYPWYGEAIRATGELLNDPNIGKIASNLKFEDRWTRKEFGFRVKNWVFDTMIGAHVLDCRKEITSIKFQAYVHLGQIVYDSHLKPFMQTNGNEQTNRLLKDVDLRDLLLYNGLDSYLEYHVAMCQMKHFGIGIEE